MTGRAVPISDWVGVRTTSSAFLDPAQANRMQVTLDRECTFADGDELPPAWHWLYFHDLVRASDLGTDGHPALGITMPPVPLPRRMWAGGELSFGRPLLLGSEATRTSTILAITPKEGRSGPLYFVTVEHDIRSGDQPAVLETQTIVYREVDTSPPQDAPVTPTEAEFTDRWHPDSTALFRYSALTFNGHRIHYDVDYARTVEGYPNLVIHGPLLATLLLDALVRREQRITAFSYRARSPLFLPDAFTVNGRREGKSARLWAAALDGRLAMEGEATCATA